jgi:hypothetical protein
MDKRTQKRLNNALPLSVMRKTLCSIAPIRINHLLSLIANADHGAM